MVGNVLTVADTIIRKKLFSLGKYPICMRAVIQRVSEAEVKVEGKSVGRIAGGLLVYLGIHASDGPELLPTLADKVINLRIFPNGEGRFDRSLLDVGGSLLVVSQFTLYGD